MLKSCSCSLRFVSTLLEFRPFALRELPVPVLVSQAVRCIVSHYFSGNLFVTGSKKTTRSAANHP